MKGKSKKILIISIITSIILLIASLLTLLLTKENNTSSKIEDIELLISKKYTDITDNKDASKVDELGYVKFSAFFTRDIDDDGNANKLLGTCRNGMCQVNVGNFFIFYF